MEISMRRRKITMAVAAALAFAAGFLSTVRSAPAPDSLEVKPAHVASADKIAGDSGYVLRAASRRAAPGS
jgi:hypothetical protein